MNRIVMAAAAGALGLACCGAGSATKTLTGETPSEVSQAVPPNYRELIADYLKQSVLDPSSVREAGISEPSLRRVGLLNGFRRPAVCAVYDAKDTAGQYVGASSTVYWFEGGRVAGARKRAAFCADAIYRPFPEAEPRPIVVRAAAPIAQPKLEPKPQRRPLKSTTVKSTAAPKPAAARSGDAKPLPAPRKSPEAPAGARPSDAKPADAKPSDAKPSEAKPAPPQKSSDVFSRERVYVDERRSDTWFRQQP